MKGCIFVFTILAFLLQSCSKGELVSVTKVTGAQNTDIQMILTSRQVYSFSPEMDSILPGVAVNVYMDDYQRSTHYNPILRGITGADGKITFHNLHTTTYYVEAYYPNLDTAQIDVTLPASALIAYEDLFLVHK